ncbi:MAG: methionyl-tRNA formyltransferase [Pseudomonadota bacterium]
MRLVFMGTPAFACAPLDALVQAGHDVAAVYTQPPRPAGRGKRARHSAVHARAIELGIPVRHPTTLKSEAAQSEFAALAPHIAVVVAYGLILPQPVLDAPQMGCLNIHASLLPRWRGAAPIQRAIMAGDRETGICIMAMEAGLDTGPVFLEKKLVVGIEETAGELHDRLSILGADAILEVLDGLPEITPRAQSEAGVTYAAKIDKSEAQVDWTQDAETIARTIRGLAPIPGAWTLMNGKRLKLLRARVETGGGAPGEVLTSDTALTVAAGSGAVGITELQGEGRGRQMAPDFLRGTRVTPGTILGDSR